MAGDETLLPGIDVSHFQGEVDRPAAAAGVRFAFIKATEGLDDVVTQLSLDQLRQLRAG